MLTIRTLISRSAKVPVLLANKVFDLSLIRQNYRTLDGKVESGSFCIDRQTKRAYDKNRYLGRQALLCYAPFKNMYFGISGNVSVCCRNESYILGNYPQESIEEIWNGEKIRRFRLAMQKNDLLLGCDECYHHLLGRNPSAVVARMFDTQKMGKTYPSMMEFELDNSCNLECAICNGRLSSSVRKNRDKLPPFQSSYDSAFLDQLKIFIPHLEEARFYGGEPFLIKLYYDIWEMMVKTNPGINIYVQTNGTILNDKIKKLLEKGRFTINVSFDALDKQLFEKLRKNARFDSIMENMMYFYNYTLKKKTFFCLTPTLMRDNWQEFPELVRFCNERNFPLFYNTLYHPEHLAINTLSSNELESIATKLETQCFIEVNKVQKQNNTHYFDIVKLIRRWQNESLDREINNNAEILSIVQFREKLIEKLRSLDFLDEGSMAFSSRLKKIDQLLSLFEDENELFKIYHKLLITPVPVVIEQIDLMENFDNETKVKLIRSYI